MSSCVAKHFAGFRERIWIHIECFFFFLHRVSWKHVPIWRHEDVRTVEQKERKKEKKTRRTCHSAFDYALKDNRGNSIRVALNGSFMSIATAATSFSSFFSLSRSLSRRRTLHCNSWQINRRNVCLNIRMATQLPILASDSPSILIYSHASSLQCGVWPTVFLSFVLFQL